MAEKLNIRTRLLVLAAAAGLSAFGAGCLSDDVGVCCEVLDPDKADRIPVAPTPEPGSEFGGQASVVRQDPAFDCSGLTCTAYQGSKAFCTRQCNEDADCPEGFTCAPVLESDPGPDSQIQPDDKFCVRAAHDCDTYEP